MTDTRTPLTRFERLLAAYVASTIEDAPGLSAELEQRLRAIGAPGWLLDNVRVAAGRWSVCDDDRTGTIVDYAAQLTRRPGTIGAADVDRLRAVGLSEAGIVELNRAVASQSYLDRMVHGLGLHEHASFSARR